MGCIKGDEVMAAKRKKSASTIQKNVLEMQQKLIQMEEQLEAAKEARYATVGRYFAASFEDCPEFDLINMSNRKLERFIGIVRAFYTPQSYRMQSDDELEEDAGFVEGLQEEQQ